MLMCRFELIAFMFLSCSGALREKETKAMLGAAVALKVAVTFNITVTCGDTIYCCGARATIRSNDRFSSLSGSIGIM